MTVFRSLGLIVYAITASTLCVEGLYACPSTASYRSVVVNDPPPEVPIEATTFKVKIESALFSPTSQNLYGLSGVLVEQTADYEAGAKIESRANLVSMCDTWVDVWTPNPHVDDDGKITGYVTGFVELVAGDGTLTIRPLLFQRAADRTSYDNGDYSRGYPARGGSKVRPVPKDAVWKPFKIDAEQISSNLSETDRLIRENLEKMEKEKADGDRVEKDDQ